MPVDAVVELVNGWGSVPRARAAGRPCPSDGPASTAALVTLADRLYPVFAARTASERARVVNALMAECDLRPALRADGDRVRSAWLVPRKRDALPAAAAVALHAQLAAHDHDRLGVCASSDCGDVYVDVSPRAHRRYCSVTCQNRERVAAFRRRSASSQRLP